MGMLVILVKKECIVDFDYRSVNFIMNLKMFLSCVQEAARGIKNQNRAR